MASVDLLFAPPFWAHMSILPRVDANAQQEQEQERALVERAQAGDRSALGILLKKYGPILYRSVLIPRLGSTAAADEALGDTYTKVIERIGQFRWQGCGIYPWLRVVALNTALDSLRKRKREICLGPEDLTREMDRASRDLADPALQVGLLEQQDLERARTKLEEALQSIHPRYATAIRLRILEERPREEVAQALGVTTPTFDVLLHRAMLALRKAISETPPFEEE